MEKTANDNINAFDSLYTTNQIQLFKVLIPYMAPPMQKNLVIYIKYMEFQYTMTLFQKHPYAAFTSYSFTDKPDTNQLFDEIIPFCDMTQRKNPANEKYDAQHGTDARNDEYDGNDERYVSRRDGRIWRRKHAGSGSAVRSGRHHGSLWLHAGSFRSVPLRRNINCLMLLLS